MTADRQAIEIQFKGNHIAGTVLTPAAKVPGVLFVHGWGGSQEQDMVKAADIAALGCVCLTFDLRGHARWESQRETVTREDNLEDVLAAYDELIRQPGVDPAAIAVVGSSYGGYLATILTTLRPVKWLAMRVPALYRDADWTVPKAKLDKKDLATYRRVPVGIEDNRALRSCGAFEGDVLVVESEHDEIVPHPAIASYVAAFRRAHSLTYRIIEGADHALSAEPCRKAYNSLLANWVMEMVLGARRG
jgi:pimeloyl-ACP methyl ester carboxylesterase